MRYCQRDCVRLADPAGILFNLPDPGVYELGGFFEGFLADFHLADVIGTVLGSTVVPNVIHCLMKVLRPPGSTRSADENHRAALFVIQLGSGRVLGIVDASRMRIMRPRVEASRAG